VERSAETTRDDPDVIPINERSPTSPRRLADATTQGLSKSLPRSQAQAAGHGPRPAIADRPALLPFARHGGPDRKPQRSSRSGEANATVPIIFLFYLAKL
jgi:hypothetical protein